MQCGSQLSAADLNTLTEPLPPEKRNMVSSAHGSAILLAAILQYAAALDLSPFVGGYQYAAATTICMMTSINGHWDRL